MLVWLYLNLFGSDLILGCDLIIGSVVLSDIGSLDRAIVATPDKRRQGVVSDTSAWKVGLAGRVGVESLVWLASV